jgi:hypothetical protein
MLDSLQKATHSILSKALHEILPRDRRNYGHDIRLWNDRDPRVDQAFFQGSVPGFVIGNDQTIVDWNIGFELIFGGCPGVTRGMPVAKWYELIDNFRRLPNRGDKLQGEAVIPITDRERVVFISKIFGRMVFMRIMSPVLDRLTGRVIGWNIALNVNSVQERVKFFTELTDRIQNSSRHARYVMGVDQVAAKSKVMHSAVEKAIRELDTVNDVLVIGAVGAAPFVEEILSSNPSSRVSIMDDDTEALRHLRNKLSRHGKRVKIVRRSPTDLSIIPEDRFDAAILLWPKMTMREQETVLAKLKDKLDRHGKVSVISWADVDGAEMFWDAVRRDLEERHEIDLIRWHMSLIKEESSRDNVLPLVAGGIVVRGLGQIVELSESRGRYVSGR